MSENVRRNKEIVKTLWNNNIDNNNCDNSLRSGHEQHQLKTFFTDDHFRPKNMGMNRKK